MEEFSPEMLDELAQQQFQTALGESSASEEAAFSEEAAPEEVAQELEEKTAPKAASEEAAAPEGEAATEEVDIESLLAPPNITTEQVRQWVGPDEWDALPAHMQRVIFTTVYNYAVAEQLRQAVGLAFEALGNLADAIEKDAELDEAADRIAAQLDKLADEYDLSDEDIEKVLDVMEKKNIQDPEVAVAYYLTQQRKRLPVRPTQILTPENVRVPRPAPAQPTGQGVPTVQEERPYTLQDAFRETLRRVRRGRGIL